MKKLSQVLILVFLSFSNASFSQLDEVIEGFVREGIELHDQGKFDEAIAKYTLAISMDSTYVLAYGERAFSHLMKKDFQACITDCERAIAMDSLSSALPAIYTTYANALDDSGKSDKAVGVYTEAIRKFPTYQMLYFNRGVTLSQKKQYDLSRKDLEKSCGYGPLHPSSHHALGVTYGVLKQAVPTILALNYFLLLESNSSRSKIDLDLIYQNLNKDVEKTGKKEVTINISESFLDMMNDSTGQMENNFAMSELLMSTTAALDFDKKFKKETEIERYERKMESLILSFQENSAGKKGFAWEFYVPFFIEMKSNGHLKTFCYLVHESRDSSEVNQWLEKHSDDVEAMYKWVKSWLQAR